MTLLTVSPTGRRPRVLFVGHDAGSPQIAASVLRQVAGDAVVVGTSGTQPADPGGRTDEMLVAMGLDPADERPLSAGSLRAADRVVVLGTDVDVARLPGPRYEQWDLETEDLLSRVEALVDELTAAPVVAAPATPAGRLRARLGELRHRLLRW
ncbi:low molecular weight phosphatase family protein [Microlunatus lacustris]